MKCLLPAPQTALVPVKGADHGLPLGRVFGIRRNCASHMHKMANDLEIKPLLFSAPPAAVMVNARHVFGLDCAELHAEIKVIGSPDAGVV